jgi:hypothetical protein
LAVKSTRKKSNAEVPKKLLAKAIESLFHYLLIDDFGDVPFTIDK